MDDFNIITTNDICCTCLSIDRNLVKISKIEDALHNLFFLLSCDSEAYELLCNKEINDLFICWECEALLQRLCKFREQVCMAQKQLENVIGNTKSNNHSLSQLTEIHQNNYDYTYVSSNENGFDISISSDDDDKPIKSSSSDAQILSDVDLASEPQIKSESDQECMNKVIVKDNTIYKTIEMNDLEMKNSIEERRALPNFVSAEFKCLSCIEMYKNKTELNLHVKTAHKRLPKHYKCDICQTYIRERWFDEHRKDHYLKFECNYCDHVSYNVLVILKHMKQGHAVKNISKEVKKLRNRSYVKNPGLKPWLADVLPDNRTSVGYVCSLCNDFFKTKRQRQIHIVRNHKPGHKCKACGRTFAAVYNLKKHEQLHSGTVRRQECPICGKVVRQDTMKAHLEIHGNRERKYKCIECDRSFVSLATYRNHMKFARRHVSDDSFRIKCPICKRGFKSKLERSDHINYTHMGKTNHKCPVCEKLISSAKLLKRHMDHTHYGIKKKDLKNKYLCQKCGKICRDVTALREHESVHTGEKPLSCEFCDDSFRSGAALFKHKKVVHNVTPKRLLIKHTDTSRESVKE